MLLAAPEKANDAESWVSTLNQRLFEVGGVSMRTPRPYIGSPELPGRRSYQLAQKPARDGQFQNCRYYWPDIVDPNFPYGEGLRLQLRSAVSHFNEVWAVESAGAVLHAFADDLPWEFVYDVARWTYDEARHCRMGLARLSEWDYHPDEIPLGSYIYDSARGQDPVVRLGQLHFFETKNIGSKTKRMEAFASYQDDMSQHDMDFDWADETIHAHYGRRWYDALRELYPERIPDLKTVLNLCSDLIEQEISTATDQDRTEIRNIAEAMINKAEEA